METITIDKDISVFYVTSKSFPDGIEEAMQRIHALVPMMTGRRYFGISRPENGAIVYRAAAEEMYAGESEKMNCATLVLKSGGYACSSIHDYTQHLPEIGKTFQQLLSVPGLDHDGYCVEWYLSDKELKCMVRLEE